MISNINGLGYDVIEITNEMPFNKLGGVGSVIENLMQGFHAVTIKPLWFLVDHNYNFDELKSLLDTFPNLVIGTYKDLTYFDAPIIHLHAYNHNPEIFLYISGRKVIFTIHSLLLSEAHSNDVDLTPEIRRQEFFIKKADQIVLVSRSELEKYLLFGYDKLNTNVTVIYNGLKQTGKFICNRANKTIGFCGRLVPRKRPEYTQQILKVKGFEMYSVLIAGRGFTHYSAELMGRYQVKSRVTYLGWCSGARLESFYNAIDVLTIPSIYEPFGMVALEAISRGIPVVCRRTGGLVEILGNNAFYSEGDDFSSFTKAMKKWRTAHRDEILKKINTAYTIYLEKFNVRRMAEEYGRTFLIL